MAWSSFRALGPSGRFRRSSEDKQEDVLSAGISNQALHHFEATSMQTCSAMNWITKFLVLN